MICKWLCAGSEVIRVKAMPAMQLPLEETIICKGTSRFLLGQEGEEKV